MGCQGLAVPAEVMQHVVRVESSFNPYAIGVVGGRLVRQPDSLREALATADMLEKRGYNFSIGLAQVNHRNLRKYGLDTYEKAFQPCPNLQAGSRILAECYSRSRGDWPKSFSCYYSGDFKTGFRHGYVQKIYSSIRKDAPQPTDGSAAIPVVDRRAAATSGRVRQSQPTTAWDAGVAQAGDAPSAPAAQFAQGQPGAAARVSLVGSSIESRTSERPDRQGMQLTPASMAVDPPGQLRHAGDDAFVF